MFWVYLIKCEDKRYYVGYTKRLYRRINEHIRKNENEYEARYKYSHCAIYKPKYLFGVYNVRKNLIYKEYSKFLNNLDNNEYNFTSLKEILEHFNKDDYNNCNGFAESDIKSDALCLENNITLCKMKQLSSKWYRLRGGNYCKEYIINNPSENYKLTRPFCNCIINIPAEIHIYNSKLYFRCAKKSMNWIDCDINTPGIDDPCDFYLEIDKKNNYYSNNYKLPVIRDNVFEPTYNIIMESKLF